MMAGNKEEKEVEWDGEREKKDSHHSKGDGRIDTIGVKGRETDVGFVHTEI